MVDGGICWVYDVDYCVWEGDVDGVGLMGVFYWIVECDWRVFGYVVFFDEDFVGGFFLVFDGCDW